MSEPGRTGMSGTVKMHAPKSWLSVDEIAEQVPDGALVALPKDDVGAAMATTRALIRRGARGLRLLTVPVGSFQIEILVGAGCVGEIETSGVSLGEFGFAPRFRDAVEHGRIVIRDATCPAIYAALQASEKGIPFMPLRGIIGSDLLGHRPDWKVIENPFAQGNDPVVALPAVTPDIALFHCRYGDAHGNVWAGAARECVLLAHASRRTLATVEEVWDGNLMDDPGMRAGTIPPVYVEAVAHAPQGAWPLALPGHYPKDGRHLRAYLAAAQTAEGFDSWLAENVLQVEAAA